MLALLWRTRLYSVDPKVLVAKKCCRTEISALMSTIEHEKARNAVLASQGFRKKDSVALYYGTLAHASFGRELQSRNQYGEVYMETTAEWLRAWAMELEESVSDSKDQKCSDWIVSASFGQLQYIKDPRYLEEGREGTKSLQIRVRKSNVQLTVSETMSRRDFSKH